MKQTLLTLTVMLGAAITSLTAQNVNIPDVAFKAYLVGNTAINTNSDTEIQLTEAAAYSGTIVCSNLGITSLTGIETFTALTYLNCGGNQLTTLYLGANTALTHALCYNNQLTSLNVSTNTQLLGLDCKGNQITSLNLTTNTALTHIACFYNQITSLDLSTNTSLISLVCYNNQLTSLNLNANPSLIYLACNTNSLTTLNVKNGNNSNVINFNASDNPALTCIEVDNATYSAATWTNISAGASFSLNCNLTTQIDSVAGNEQTSTVFYPNPAINQLNIILTQYSSIQIVNLLGEIVYHTKAEAGKAVIDVSQLNSGVYLLQTQNGKSAKFVKE